MGGGRLTAPPLKDEGQMKKSDREITKLMSRYGFIEKRRTGGHSIWVNQDGITITTSTTPSGGYVTKQTESLLRNKYGLSPS